MKRLASLSLTFVIAVCLLIGSERRAWAYVDPGTGLIALQTIASVVAAYAYFVRRKIRAFFVRRQPAEAAAASVREPSTPCEPA
ncbi:MAG: hypothetical protein NVSMB62_14310 [Acidobacteriaceae bacterium]